MTAWTTFDHHIVLSGAPEAVFAALTEPAQLTRWFAQHVEIEPHSGGHYRFWGRSTYDTPRAADASQQLVEFEYPTTLAYEWLFTGIPSRVSITLAPESEATPAHTRLSLRHAFERLPGGARPRELIEDLWRMTLGNLEAHLCGGSNVVMPDFTDTAPQVRTSVLIDAPPERVFQALLDPKHLDRWISSAARVEPRVGGRYEYGWSYPIGDQEVAGGPTRILELVPDRKLVTDWPDWRGDPGMPDTQVTWLLEPVGSQTRVTLIHTGFTRPSDLSDYPQGWADFLHTLQATLPPAA